MSTYAIGDIQGCYNELRQLVDSIQFNPDTDKLLFAGDLVNRGPDSLATLRFVKSLGDAADSVLGNHDMHLLALSQGNLSHQSGSTLDDILSAPDRDELLDWLRHRPFLIFDDKTQSAVIHAGLPPQWSLSEARRYSQELEQTLQGDDFNAYCMDMYGNKPKKWKDSLQGMDRLRFITNCFTRLRFCTNKGKLSFSDKGPPGTQQEDFLPWYEVADRKTANDLIYFGHWSTLPLAKRNNAWSLDTGCLWGGSLSAVRLEDQQVFQVSCDGVRKPDGF